MRAIFISYRREDSEGQAGRLFDDLTRQFGEDSVFMDVVGIEPGRDFRQAIDQHVASCGVLLAVIGRNWAGARNESGQRRLDDPMDFVRMETAAALKRDIPVVPVLVQGASIPRVEDLPEDLRDLPFRAGVQLTHVHWISDLQVLIKALRPYLQAPASPQAAEEPKTTAAPPATEAPKTTAGPSMTLAPAVANRRKVRWKVVVPTCAGLAFIGILALAGLIWRCTSAHDEPLEEVPMIEATPTPMIEPFAEATPEPMMEPTPEMEPMMGTE